jgi:hypothetical protein
MSKELTLEIMRSYGLSTSPDRVIAFIAKAELSKEQEDDLRASLQQVEVPALIRNIDEFNKFYDDNQEVFNIPSKEIAGYLGKLADKLDRNKSIQGYETLLQIIPVKFLNDWHIPWLITNTMDYDFWHPRVTSKDNKVDFSRRFPDRALAANLPEFGSSPVSLEDAKRAYETAITPEEKILALRYLVHLKSNGHFGQDYFNNNLSDLSTQEKLEHLEKDYQFLDLQENAEASESEGLDGKGVRCVKEILATENPFGVEVGEVICKVGQVGTVSGNESGYMVHAIKDLGYEFSYDTKEELAQEWEVI